MPHNPNSKPSIEGTIDVTRSQSASPSSKPSIPINQNQASTPPSQRATTPVAMPKSTPTPLQQPQSSRPTPPPVKAPPPASYPIKKSPFRLLVPIVVIALLLGGGYYVYNLILSRLNPTPAEPQTITLTYWGLWEPTEVLSQIFTDFQATHPGVIINYTQQSYQDYRERLQSNINEGNGPDVFRFHQTWTPMLSRELDVIPSDIINPATFETTFYPSATDWLRTKKGLVGIPIMFDGLGLYYNRDILSAAGKNPPTTWDELHDLATILTIKQENQILRSGVAIGTTSNIDHWPDILGLMLLQNGANPQKPNTTGGQDAIKFYTLFTTVNKIWDDTLPTSTVAFATEKTAMMLAPSWRAHEVHELNPELNFAIAPAPRIPGTDVTWASFWAEGVSSQTTSAQKTAAWQLLAYLSEKETLRRLYANASSAPGRIFGEPFSRVDLADQLLGDPYVGAYLKDAPTAQGWFLSSATHDNGLNDRIIKYYQDAINAVVSGTDPADALVTTEQGIAQVYSQFGLSQ
jgi:multiple sugar transport system substrate-binding protein